MSDSTNGGELQHENKVWKVFALLKQQERDIMLKRDSEVLYQVHIILLLWQLVSIQPIMDFART